jgi:putative redox protein
VAVLAAPFDVQHVMASFGDGLAALMELGEAKVDLGGRPFNMRRSFIEDLRKHDQGARIADLRRALLVLHSPTDQTVGVEHAGAIFQAAKHPKSYVSLADADHLLTRPSDAAYAADVIAAWSSRYLGGEQELAEEMPGDQVVVEETGNGNFQVVVKAGGTRFIADEPVAVGGLGSGPGPFDILSAALGACTAMTLRMYARQKKWPVSHLRVSVAHSKDKDQNPPDLFTREITIAGDIDAAQRARMIEIAEKCPVHKTLTTGARIATQESRHS